MTRFLDLVHPDAGTALMSEWLTGTAERSRAAADAVIAEWAAAPTPAGRLAQHLFLSTDGAGLLFYAQWTSDDDHLSWARAHRAAVVSRVDTDVPGIERPELRRTRLDHSVLHDPVSPSGLFVVTAVPVAEAEALTRPVRGLLAAHVHLAADGERATVVAEWTDAASHAATAQGAPAFERYVLHPAF